MVSITPKVMIADVQGAVQAQLQEALDARARGMVEFDFSQYHKIDDINTWVLSLPASYPGLVEVFQVATSYERRPIYAVKVFKLLL